MLHIPFLFDDSFSDSSVSADTKLRDEALSSSSTSLVSTCSDAEPKV